MAHGAQDIRRMGALFERSVNILCAVSALIGVFLAVEAPAVTRLFGGRGFVEASWALRLMMFYPMFQTLGQLSGSVFYATGDTPAYRNLGILSFLFGLPFSVLSFSSSFPRWP